MEKSRAIEVLKPLVNSYVDYANITMKEEDDNIVEALEMAIDALAQPKIVHCGDCAMYDSKEHCERDVRDVFGCGREWNEDDFCSCGIRRTNG